MEGQYRDDEISEEGQQLMDNGRAASRDLPSLGAGSLRLPTSLHFSSSSASSPLLCPTPHYAASPNLQGSLGTTVSMAAINSWVISKNLSLAELRLKAKQHSAQLFGFTGD